MWIPEGISWDTIAAYTTALAISAYSIAACYGLRRWRR